MKKEIYMKRFSQSVLYALVAVLLLWQLPWCYTFFAGKPSQPPFALYSGVAGDFLLIGSEGGKGRMCRDLSGNIYTQEQTDSLLPFFYVRQLVADDRFPDTIQGVPVTQRDVHLTNFSFRASPKELNAVHVPLYPLLESRSKRVDLAMPDDVFRIGKEGIEFVRMASNTVDEEKSRRYTEALKKKGFVFPALRVAGNPTARKDYDEGYLLLDSERKLFHLKQVVGRPYVRAVAVPEGVQWEHLFITEFKSRRTLGFLTDTAHRLYVLDAQYKVTCTGIPAYDPEKEALSVFGNMLDWTVCVKGKERVAYYALKAEDYSLLKKAEFPVGSGTLPGLRFTSVWDKWVKPRFE